MLDGQQCLRPTGARIGAQDGFPQFQRIDIRGAHCPDATTDAPFLLAGQRAGRLREQALSGHALRPSDTDDARIEYQRREESTLLGSQRF